MSLLVHFAPRAFVDRELGIDPVAMILRQPLRAVERAGRLFTAGQRNFDSPPRFELLLRVTHQGIDPDGRLGLVVHRAARIERAVLFHQHERIARPVLALRFHHVDVRQQQDGLGLRIAAREYRDQPAFLGMVRRGEDLHLREPRGFEASRHALRRQRAASVGQRGVGLDELLVELAELRLRRHVTSSRRR